MPLRKVYEKSTVGRPKKSLADERKPQSKDELRQIALHALVEVADDGDAPAAARAAAARTILESLGDIGRLQEVARASEKPLTEMSAKEVQEEIERLRGAV